MPYPAHLRAVDLSTNCKGNAGEQAPTTHTAGG